MSDKNVVITRSNGCPSLIADKGVERSGCKDVASFLTNSDILPRGRSCNSKTHSISTNSNINATSSSCVKRTVSDGYVVGACCDVGACAITPKEVVSASGEVIACLKPDADVVGTSYKDATTDGTQSLVTNSNSSWASDISSCPVTNSHSPVGCICP